MSTAAAPVPTTFDPARLASVPPVTRFDLLALVRAELTIAFKGYPKLWFAGAMLIAASLALVQFRFVQSRLPQTV